MTDAQLMLAIKVKYGEWIDTAVEGTPFRASLVAALVANESGLDDAAQRLEPAVLSALTLVLIGRKANFGSIGGQDLKKWLGRIQLDGQISPPVAIGLGLANLASSWGPTQIMGYQALAADYPLSDLTNIQTHFRHTVEILADFQKRFGLVAPIGQVQSDGALFFTCWNTGSPTGKTFDPAYADNGMRRLELYEDLEAPSDVS